MGFTIEQSDRHGHIGWIMPNRGAANTRAAGPRRHAEFFPTREEAQRAVEKLKGSLPARTFQFDIEPQEAS